MASRRMISKSIVESDMFLDMPASAKLLYFYLIINADDDGFINGPKKVIRITNSTEDDLKVLMAKSFIYLFETGVVVIKHWKMQNSIQKDRYHKTTNVKEMNMLMVAYDKSYELVNPECINNGLVRVSKMDTSCIQNDSMMETEVSVGKDSIGENRLGQYRLEKCSALSDNIAYSMGNEKITVEEYNNLTHTFTKALVDGTIRRIIEKPYRNCLNYDTVYKWCEEDKGRDNNYALADSNKKSSKYKDGIVSLEMGGDDDD